MRTVVFSDSGEMYKVKEKIWKEFENMKGEPGESAWSDKLYFLQQNSRFVGYADVFAY